MMASGRSAPEMMRVRRCRLARESADCVRPNPAARHVSFEMAAFIVQRPHKHRLGASPIRAWRQKAFSLRLQRADDHTQLAPRRSVVSVLSAPGPGSSHWAQDRLRAASRRASGPAAPSLRPGGRDSNILASSCESSRCGRGSRRRTLRYQPASSEAAHAGQEVAKSRTLDRRATPSTRRQYQAVEKRVAL